MFRLIILLFVGMVAAKAAAAQKPSIIFYHCDVAPTDSTPCTNSSFDEHQLEAIAIKKTGNRMDTTWKCDVFVSYVFLNYDYEGPLQIKVFRSDAYFDKNNEYHDVKKMVDSVDITKQKGFNYLWRRLSFNKPGNFWVRLYIYDDLVSDNVIFIRKPE